MKAVLKAAAGALAWLLAAPLAYPVRWLAPVDRRDALFAMGSQMVSLLPGLPGTYVRRAFYRVTLGLASTGFVVEFGAILAQRGIEIGRDAYIGPFANIGLSAIGDDVLLGSGVHVISGRKVHHFGRTDVPIRAQPMVLEKVRVGRGAWVGNGAVVMADVGEEAVVGAGSVVVEPVPAWAVAAGNPARVIRDRRGPEAVAEAQDPASEGTG
jgi:virginiamycin A acetyltransferase